MALVHLWSLSCEMQFYLIAPVIFILAGRDRRRRMLVFGGFALALAGVGLIYPMRGSQYLAIKYHFEIAAWPMAFGVFCEFAKPWFLGIPRGVVRFIFGFGAAALTVVVIVMLCGMEAKKLVIATGGLLLFPCLLSYLFGLTVPGVIGRWLAWCGARTYSIYLCQQPFTLCRYLPPMLGTFGGRGLNRRWGGLVSHIRIARSESEPDVPFSRDGTSRDKYGYQDRLIPIRCPGRQRLCLVWA